MSDVTNVLDISEFEFAYGGVAWAPRRAPWWATDSRAAYVRRVTLIGHQAYRETLVEAGFSDAEIAAIEAEITDSNNARWVSLYKAPFYFPSRPKVAN